MSVASPAVGWPSSDDERGARPEETMNLELEPGDWVDDFQIVRVLARSGMGSVFRARQRTAGRTVVLKVPHLHLESDVMFFSRFSAKRASGCA